MPNLVSILGGPGGSIGKTFIAPQEAVRSIVQPPQEAARSFATPPATANAEELRSAREMGLTARPKTPTKTPGAGTLIDALVSSVIAHTSRKNAIGPRGLPKLRLAVGAVLGDILSCWAKDPPAMTFRTSKEETFTGEAVTYTYFRMALDGLLAGGMVRRHAGIRYVQSDIHPSDGRAARYWPATVLLDAAGSAGLRPDNLDEHFAHVFPARPPKVPHPVLIRPFRSRGRGRSDAAPPDYRDTTARAIRQEVEMWNAFAGTFDVEGCRPPRFRRMFTGELGLHGRWYAAGSANYQGLDKQRRVAITINGQPVVELDARASFLTILHGVFGLPLPGGDPYALPGIPRNVVKAGIVATLGKGSIIRRWSKGSLRNTPDCASYSATTVGGALIHRYPFLAKLGDIVAHLPESLRGSRGVVAAFLMGNESSTMTAAMGYVREHAGALALPVHDSLIVPESVEAIGRQGIAEGFMRFAKVVPVVEVSRRASSATGRPLAAAPMAE